MIGIPVQIVGEGIDWPAWFQAGSAGIAIPVSVWLGLLLQDRDRDRKELAELRTQIAALRAIAERAVASITRLHDRAQRSDFKRSDLPWLTDETAALEATVAGIDLMLVKSVTLIGAVAELQQAARTTRRRLAASAEEIGNLRQPKKDRFQDPLDRAVKALSEIARNESGAAQDQRGLWALFRPR